MCIIGSVFDTEKIFTFKQCDLSQKVKFFEPEIRTGKAGKYIAFAREGRPGIWAGINNYGVSFTAADVYTTKEYEVSDHQVNNLFLHYEQSIADFQTARKAIDFLKSFFLEKFPAPDKVLISDRKESIYLEFSPEEGCREKIISQNFLVSTNHFDSLSGSVSQQENPSTYIRLKRAKEILEKNPLKKGIKKLLQDENEGKSENSICRYSQKDREFFTQAVVLFTVSPKNISVEYVVNGNLREKSFLVKKIQDFF